MGSKIIVRNADFSACAVAQTPNYTAQAIGSSEAIWSNATSTGSNGTFGALVQTAGYVSGLRMYSPTAGSVKSDIRIYEKNGSLKATYDVMSTPIKQGTHDYVFSSPISVSVDDVVCIHGGTGAFTMMYNSSGGNYPVSTSNGNVPDSGWRIYPFTFILQVQQ